MEVVGLVLASAGATSKLSEAVWSLCDSWSNAPASVHELRDFLTRTQDFWAAVQAGLNQANSSYNNRSFGSALQSEKAQTPMPPPQWEGRSSASLVRLLQQGLGTLENLAQILEEVAGGTDGPGDRSNKNTPAALSSRRKFQWMRYLSKVRKFRAELSRANDLIYGHLLVLNV